MQTSQANLKVSFYLEKNVSRNGLSPVMGRITIGKEMVQFSCKLKADPNLWDTRAGRINGKSKHADLVVFPKGLSCVWQVKKAVRKHYVFN